MSEDDRPFLDPDTISQHLHCVICTTVFRDAVRIYCGHTYCRTCIEDWEHRGNNTCPKCRERFSKKTTVRDMLAENLVQELKVKCTNSGCAWLGPLSNYDAHREHCSYHPSKVEKWLSQFSDSELKSRSLLKQLYCRAPDAAKLLASSITSQDYRHEVVPFALLDENVTPVKKYKLETQ